MAGSKVAPVRTCLSQSPHPPFQGGDQGLRAFHRRLPSLLASSGPASDDALLFYWDSVPNPDAPRGLYVLHVFAVANTRTRLSQFSIPLTPFSRGHVRAFGLSIASWLSLPADSGRSSDDDLLNPLNPMFFIETLSQTAIPDNRCLTECDFIRENPPSSGQVIDFE